MALHLTWLIPSLMRYAKISKWHLRRRTACHASSTKTNVSSRNGISVDYNAGDGVERLE